VGKVPHRALRQAFERYEETETSKKRRWRAESIRIARDFNVIRAMYRIALDEWDWLKVNVLARVKSPTPPPGKERVMSPKEVKALCAALGYTDGGPTTQSQRVALGLLFPWQFRPPSSAWEIRARREMQARFPGLAALRAVANLRAHADFAIRSVRALPLTMRWDDHLEKSPDLSR
jgi:hypothetical protein